MKNLFLALLLAWNVTHAYKEISGDTLQSWMDSGTKFDFIVIDVRDAVDEIITNDTCRPYHFDFSADELEAAVPRLPRNIPLVLYCRTGNTSGEAAEFLDDLGYTCFSLTGGIEQWSGSTAGPSQLKEEQELPAPSMRAEPMYQTFANIGCDTLETWMTQGTGFDFILLDLRNDDEVSESIIANDTCRPYHLSWDEGDLTAYMSSLPENVPLVVYCRSGNRSVEAALPLAEAGYTVYNLIGGITVWNLYHGPTGVQEDLKPLSELPAPSMENAFTVAISVPGSKPGAYAPGVTLLSPCLSKTLWNQLTSEGNFQLLMVTNIAGKQLMQVRISESNTRLPFPHLPEEGLYILTFR